MAKKPSYFNKIESLKKRYLAALPGKESLIKILNEAEVPEQVYNSNAIENSTLSLEETEKILLQIDLDRYINQREIFETKNLARVVEYIDAKTKEIALHLDMILFLHKMLISNIRDDVAGRFRNPKEWVRVGTHIAPDPQLVLDLLRKLLKDYEDSAQTHIVRKIALFHLMFEHIHPFVDGNGRIGRVLNNYLLMRDGYVPINIAFVDRALYYEAFKAFERDGATSLMEEIVGRALTNSYQKRLAYMEGKDIVTLNEYAKKHKLSHSNLLNKAGRQTIEAFREKGVWKIAADAPFK